MKSKSTEHQEELGSTPIAREGDKHAKGREVTHAVKQREVTHAVKEKEVNHPTHLDFLSFLTSFSSLNF
jgi:hypothetical protein